MNGLLPSALFTLALVELQSLSVGQIIEVEPHRKRTICWHSFVHDHSCSLSSPILYYDMVSVYIKQGDINTLKEMEYLESFYLENMDELLEY